MSIDFNRKENYKKIMMLIGMIVLILIGVQLYLNHEHFIKTKYETVLNRYYQKLQKEQIKIHSPKKETKSVSMISIFHLNYAKAKNIAILMHKNIPKCHLFSDERTNSLIVENPADCGLVKDVIKQLDVPVPQVFIEARIANIDYDDEKTLGIHFNVSPISLFSFAQSAKIDMQLAALEKEGRAEIISRPKLMTTSQQSASIEAGEEIPYQSSGG